MGTLNRQTRAERQNTFDWLHILPVRVTISQYKSYSANGSHILPVQVIFCQQELYSAIMFCRNYVQFNRQFFSALPFCSALPIQYIIPLVSNTNRHVDCQEYLTAVLRIAKITWDPQDRPAYNKCEEKKTVDLHSRPRCDRRETLTVTHGFVNTMYNRKRQRSAILSIIVVSLAVFS